MGLIKMFFKDEEFFKTDKEGRGIFYPWAYPGEAFYVDQKKKNQIKFCLYSFVALLGLTVFFIIFGDYNTLIGKDWFYYLGGISGIIFPVSYILIMCLFRKSAELHTVKKEDRPSKKTFHVWLLLIIAEVFPVWGILTNGTQLTPFSAIFVLIAVSYIMYISYFFMMLSKRKGYHFSTEV